ncbi:MAG: hypothetical protein MUE69_23485 [Myxococcota bacterium]|nr:hypothetical protein [Myxococcota bacterium]
MSRPQYVVRGQVILADRMSLEHRFLLRPDRQMRELFFYLLQVYAEVHGIRLHAVVLMSTHYHLLFTDVRGVRAIASAPRSRAARLFRGAGRLVREARRVARRNGRDPTTPRVPRSWGRYGRSRGAARRGSRGAAR